MKIKLSFFIALSFLIIPSTICWAQSSFWTGDGGKEIVIAVLEPTSRGLSSDEQKWMTSIVQSSITGDFNKFSAMKIIDRQNLEKILDEQKQSLSGNYSDYDYIRIGQLTNARYILAGSITKTANAYMLEFSVTDAQSGERKASFPPKQVSSLAIENLSAIKEATADLLEQMGVTLTALGRQELTKTANTNSVQAEMALARGITAQRQGTVVEALSHFIQASNYDTSLAEAASRMNILSTNISSGNIGADTRNEIAWRRQWIQRLEETETFFVDYVKEPQPYYMLYSTNIQKGNKINWQNETIALSFSMQIIPEDSWMKPINGVIDAIKNGFASTKKAQEWQINWPASRAKGGNTVFTSQTKNYTVVAEIINDTGKSIGRQTVTIPYGYEIKDGIITSLRRWEGTVSFPEVKADDITDTLNIQITSIDGIKAENAARQKNISIMTQAAYKTMLTDKKKAEDDAKRAEQERIAREKEEERLARLFPDLTFEEAKLAEQERQRAEQERQRLENERIAKAREEVNLDLERWKKRMQFLSATKRNQFVLEIFSYNWEQGNHSKASTFFAISPSFYWSPLPFFSFGAEAHLMGLEWGSGNVKKYTWTDSEGIQHTSEDDIEYIVSFSPQVGLVFPITRFLQIHVDGLIEMSSTNLWHGILNDSITRGFASGIIVRIPQNDQKALIYNLKYIGLWWNKAYTHRIGFGVGIEWR